MLMTTTPFLPGRIYREVGLVIGGCYSFNDGTTHSTIDNAYYYALGTIERNAQRLGCNAVIGLHLVMGEGYFITLIGTAIVLEPDTRSEEELRHMWDFLPRLTQDL